MKNAITTGALAVALATVAGCGSSHKDESDQGSAGRAERAGSGAFVYSKELPDGPALYGMQADGTGERQIVDVDGAAVNADWSPDGRRIVFEIDHEKPSYCSIALVNADGSGLTDLAANKRDCDNQPSFTPDGKGLMYVHYDPKADRERIATMDVTGAHRRFIKMPWRNGVADPNMSPDGSKVSFLRLRSEEQKALFVMNPDGSAVRRLTPYRPGVSNKSDWTSDGTHLLTTANVDPPDGESANIEMVAADGAGVKALTHFDGEASAYSGSYSPDDTQIVLRLERDDSYRLAVMDRDGGPIHPLVRPGKYVARAIDWGPAALPRTQVGATAPAPVTQSSALVGEWRTVNVCADELRAFARAGLVKEGLEFMDNGDAANPCKGVAPVRHSHSFGADGAFASFDAEGRQVDDDAYKNVDAHTFTLGDPPVKVRYRVKGRTARFRVVVSACKTARCRRETAYVISAFFPLTYMRVR